MMDLKTIRNELHKLTALVEGWENPRQMPALERDLALEKLRTLYEALRFADPGPAADAPTAEAEPSDTTSVAIDLGEVLSLDSLPEAEEVAAAGPVSAAASEAGGSVAEQEPAVEPAPEIFTDSEQAGEPDVEVPEVSESEASLPQPAGLAEEPKSAPEPTLQPVPAAEPASVAEPASGAKQESEPTALAEPMPESAAAVFEPAAKAEAKAEPQPQSEPAADPAPQPAAKPQYIAPTLFGLEEETVRHRHKQRVIMSLYDTPAPAEKPARPEPAPKPVQSAVSARPVETPVPAETTGRPASAEFAARPEPEEAKPFAETESEPEKPQLAEPVVPDPLPVHDVSAEIPQEEPEDEGNVFEEIPVATVSESRAESESAFARARASSTSTSTVPEPTPVGAVLGEVINHDVQTLADTIAPPRDVASRLRHSEPVTDLRRAIGINDKFLMIRDLFGGDGAAYDEAIATLNGFDDLDDCMIYIAENYAWNPNSDGAKMLMELLERKFA